MIYYEKILVDSPERYPKSKKIVERAKKTLLSHFITGTYHSPINVTVVDRAKGSRFWDVDGNEYLDMLSGFGALMLGHASEISASAAKAAIDKSSTYAMAHEGEVRMAELMSPVRFLNLRLKN